MATTDLSHYDKTTIPNASNMAFGIVVSKWNSDITENLYKGAIEVLTENGASPDNIYRMDVPGSFELIYGAKKMLESKPVDAVIVIGNVIQGQTKHFDFVCEGVAQGIKDLNIKYDIPVIFCVLTDNEKQQSIDRSGGVLGNKGIEAGVAAIEMVFINKTF
ncbi:MAG: 6,7-dimethyl-8-ribityllumazine synthase [Flavobacteriaceae bacterium]|nr:6,7-dimethyl-8-ribityllumazine synthase [Flavobacteriaceae bacterium]